MLDAAHALALVGPQIELAVIGWRRQVRFVEWYSRAMQEHFTPDPAHAGPDGTVNVDGI